MIKRSFLGLVKPKLEMPPVPAGRFDIQAVPTPGRVTLLLEKPKDSRLASDTVALSKGDRVKTGQKICLSSDSTVYTLSPVTGTVFQVSPSTGNFGTTYIAVSVEVEPEDVFDEAFQERMKQPDAALAGEYLSALPGSPPFRAFFRENASIDTLCIMGVDSDFLSTTQRYILGHQKGALKRGINGLKTLTGVEKIVLAVPAGADPQLLDLGAEVREVSALYPYTLPRLLMQVLFGQTVPAGKTCEDLGTVFFSAEAVAALGEAMQRGRFPGHKVLTVTGKDQTVHLVTARIGTPVREIFHMLEIETRDLDRIVFGGPMTGSAVHSEDQPILPHTDAVFVQDRSRIPPVSQNPCVNCGECVRICPARIPVNMLVRYLEAGRYDEAADLYDLHCCIACGLCSFVCVARIPIFQYIRLGKYELERMHAAEANHA